MRRVSALLAMPRARWRSCRDGSFTIPRGVGKYATGYHRTTVPTDHARPRRGRGGAGADRDGVHRRIRLGPADVLAGDGCPAGAHHAPGRLHHRLAGLLARLAVDPVAAHRLHQHQLRRHAPCHELRHPLRRRQRRPRRLSRHQDRRPAPAARLAVRDPPGHRDHAPRHQRRVEQHPDSHHSRRLLHPGGPDAGQQTDHEDLGRADPADASEQLPAVRATGREPQRRDSRLGQVEEHDTIAHHRGGPVDRLQRRHRHHRRGAPQQLRQPEDVGEVVGPLAQALGAARAKQESR